MRRILKPTACVALVHKAKKINALAVTSNKLTNNFAGLVITSFRPDAARGPLHIARWSKVSSFVLNNINDTPDTRNIPVFAQNFADLYFKLDTTHRLGN